MPTPTTDKELATFVNEHPETEVLPLSSTSVTNAAVPEPYAERILLAEDSPIFGRRIYDALSDRGCIVTWVYEFLQADANSFCGCLALSQELIYSSWSDYSAAFVDDDLPGPNKGPIIAPFLLAQGVECCGISSFSNGRLMGVGVKVGCKKAEVPARIDELLAELKK
jgi:hypothetical protein